VLIALLVLIGTVAVVGYCVLVLGARCDDASE